MEHYRFFNSTQEDPREYLAEEFAEYFNRFLSDGLYTEDGRAGLKVIPNSGLNVAIQTGYGYVRGYMYHNDDNLIKTLDSADAIFDRIDRVVLKFDEVAREIRIQVKKGTPASNPTVPTLTDTAYVKELGLAQVRVRKSSASIATADILDERLTSACGLVSSLIDIPVQEMWDIWNGTLADIQATWSAFLADTNTEWTDQKSNIQSDWDQIKLAWNAWFDSVQNVVGVRVMVGATEPAELEAGDLWLQEV